VRKDLLCRRDVLKGSAALAAAAPAAFATRVLAQAPEPAPITPALIEAARKEGKLAFYTAMDIPVAERFAKAFEARFPGVAVRVERSGSERVYQRIEQERGSSIHAVDVVNSADAAHFVVWKRNGWLAPYLPEEAAKHFPSAYRDPEATHITTRVWLCSLGYNTNLVKAEEAPRSFADLLDPKWMGRMIKAHPAYSGTIMTATFQITRELGWEYLEKLAKQKIMQVQSSTDPPKKLALGERAVMADGNDYNLIQLKEKRAPVEVVYPTEGTPVVTGPSAVFASAPNPNAARLFHNWLHALEAQQLLVDFAAQHSVHAQVTPKPGRRRLADIKLMQDDPAGVEKMSEAIKTRYSQIFKV
jgi:ABC-type Fe3+ transport system substrate-binding protein